MGTPQVALCAMPLSAGKDLLLYGVALFLSCIRWRAARVSQVTGAVDVNADGRRMSAPRVQHCTACEGLWYQFHG